MNKLLSTFLCFFFLTPLSIAKTTTKIDAETNKQSWILSDSHLELTIAQITPEQARAFYLARGFPSSIAADIANSCMMQAIAKNTGSKGSRAAITLKLKEWKIKKPSESNKKEGKLLGIKLKEIWDKEWTSEKVNKAARIAFRWATFPTEQTFEPHGDYNWGMISFGLPAASTFDLEVTWHQGEEKQSTWIHNLTCAKESEND